MSDKDNQIKLSYVGAQFRVKLELCKDICLQTPQPPEDILKRAKAKMESIKASKEIDFYLFYQDKLKLLWNSLAANKSIPGNKKLSFTLAEGCPPLPGVTVKPIGLDNKTIATITISAQPSQIASWKPDWLELLVNKTLQDSGHTNQVNSSQIYGTWLKACSGETIDNSALSATPNLGSLEEIAEKPYSIIANKARQEISLIIRDLNAVVASLSNADLLKLINDAASKVSKQFGGNYYLLKKEISNALVAAASGPQSIGIDLPLVILGATTTDPTITLKQFNTNYPGSGKIIIEVSKNGLDARIVGFDMNLYSDPSFTMNEEWLKNEIKRHGISPQASEPYIEDVMKMINKGENLQYVCVAEGDPGIGGTNPYLCAVYKETAHKNVSIGQEKIDLRSLQQRTIVTVDQLIAEIRYKNPPRIGKDIFGNDMEPLPNEKLEVTIGEGVKQKEPGKYYATIEGVPNIDIEKRKVSVSKAMIHEGDVNLRTGNIIFDGPVEITGSVDTGAKVEATGDITIKGSIRGGWVITKGNLTVKNGIVTGQKGFIRIKGNVNAEFIENSKAECSGHIIVRKAIINSDIIGGGDIRILDETAGILAGGNIACLNNIYTANLAFKNGAMTYLNVGVDWKIEKKVRIRKARLAKLEKINEDDRKTLRELTSRKNQDRNIKIQEKKDHYQKRLQKERVLIDKARKSLQDAELLLTYNPNSKIFIPNFAYANCNIQIGGGPANLVNDMAGIAVLAKRKNGSKIVPIDIGEKMQKEEEANSKL